MDKVDLCFVSQPQQEALKDIEHKILLALTEHQVRRSESMNLVSQMAEDKSFAKREMQRLCQHLKVLSRYQKGILADVRKNKETAEVTKETSEVTNKTSEVTKETSEVTKETFEVIMEISEVPKPFITTFVATGVQAVVERHNSVEASPVMIKREIFNVSPSKTPRVDTPEQILQLEKSPTGATYSDTCSAEAAEDLQQLASMPLEDLDCLVKNTDFLMDEYSEHSSRRDKFLLALDLVPTKDLHLKNLKEQKRVTRQKRSTANHTHYVYDDIVEDKKKRKKPTCPETETKETKVQITAKANAFPILTQEKEIEIAKKQLLELQGRIPASRCTVETNTFLKPPRHVVIKNKHSIMDVSPLSKAAMARVPIMAPDEKYKFKHHTILGAPKEKDEWLGPHKRHVPAIFRTSQKKKALMMSLLSDEGGPKKAEAGPKKAEAEPGPSHKSSNLSLKIPGLPESLTIERIVDNNVFCCMCRKQGIISVNLDSSHAPNLMTACMHCHVTYHMACSRTCRISVHFHFCPHCFTKQRSPRAISPLVDQTVPQSTVLPNQEHLSKKQSLVKQNQRLLSEKRELENKAMELNLAMSNQASLNSDLLVTESSTLDKIKSIRDLVTIMKANASTKSASAVNPPPST